MIEFCQCLLLFGMESFPRNQGVFKFLKSLQTLFWRTRWVHCLQEEGNMKIERCETVVRESAQKSNYEADFRISNCKHWKLDGFRHVCKVSATFAWFPPWMQNFSLHNFPLFWRQNFEIQWLKNANAVLSLENWADGVWGPTKRHIRKRFEPAIFRTLSFPSWFRKKFSLGNFAVLSLQHFKNHKFHSPKYFDFFATEGQCSCK